MKTKFRSIGLALLAAIFIAAGAGASYAQECDDMDAINALDKKIRDNYAKNPTLKVAVDAAKEFLEKFGKCPGTEEFVTWVNGQMPTWETRLKKYDEAQRISKLFATFDEGINNKKHDDVYSAGKQLLATEAESKNVHVMIPLGLIALNEAANKNNKYNDDALRYAKMAIDSLNAGAPPKMRDGKPVLNKNGQPAYSTWDFSKEEAIDELKYSIAFINFYAKNDRKTALPLYYELSQSKGRFKDEPRIYVTIATYYREEADKIGAEIVKLIEKQKAAPTDEEKEKIDVEIKAKVGLFNGYAERALDALGRGHKVATDKAVKDVIFADLQKVYKQRFEKDAGLNEYIAAALAKPFPNPTSEVTPINDPDPADSTTTNTSTSATPAPANGKTAVTKPNNK